jgi:allophanate hydrolase
VHLEGLGCHVVDIDLAPFLQAGLLLYAGAFVAERYAAVGAWIAVHPGDVDPTVGPIISAAAALGAPQLASDTQRLAALRRTAAREWQRVGADSLLLPTVTLHPTLSEVASDPIGVNTALGTFTTFLNLLDMCAVAVPFGTSAGLPFGLSCIGPAFTDLVQCDIASRLEQGGTFPATPRPTATSWLGATAGRPAPPGITLGVVGAHLSGQPLNHQLTGRGARLLGATTTAAHYRLFALDTVPAKPGLVRVGAGGEQIAVEIWELSPAGFGDFVAQVPSPMTIGSVELADGTRVPGFLCEPVALDDAVDITAHGGWRAYLNSA